MNQSNKSIVVQVLDYYLLLVYSRIFWICIWHL